MIRAGPSRPPPGPGRRRPGGGSTGGQPALYLSLGIVTAVSECTQGLANRLQPLTACKYDVDCDPVADLRTADACGAHGVDPADLGYGWLALMLGGQEPPSWTVAARLANQGHAGLLVPSFVPGAGAADVNLVLWRWGDALPHRVAVFDPKGRLPGDARSWEA